MEKSKARLILRFLLVALFAMVVLSIGIAIVADKLLPEALADWVHQENSGDFGVSDIIGLMFWGAGLFLFFVSMAGLFFYQRWAAWMMAAVIAIFSVQLIFSPTVEPGILSLLGSLSDVLTGLVLGVAFFSDALQAGD
jgi:Zn-dependent protease with chaperone function